MYSTLNYSRAILFCIVVAAPAVTFAAPGEQIVPIGNPEACNLGPLRQFGRYVGSWEIEDETLAQDGSGWQPGAGAKWNFVCLGDGTAIQDFWMPNGGEVGTNLRTYNTNSKSWDIVWAVKSRPGYAEIEAKLQADDSIVMHYKDPLQEPRRRITFYPPTKTGWDWKLEFSRDKGKTWLEVYRIRAKPILGSG